MIPTRIFTTNFRLGRGNDPTPAECVGLISDELKRICEEKGFNPSLNIVRVEYYGPDTDDEGVPRVKVLAYVSDTLADVVEKR